jgi:cytochrome c oxidase subunit 2
MRPYAACALILLVLAVAGCGGGGSGSSATATPAATGGGADGRALFAANGCSGCHTLAKAGANGTTGPDLDKQLQSDAKSAGKPLREFVRQSIVEPDAFVAKGYSSGLMPKDFGDKLSPEELKTLVDYVSSAGR